MGTKHPFLYSSLFFTSKPHWIDEKPYELQNKSILSCQFKFQHTHDLVDCEIFETAQGLIVKLIQPKRALTEGQYAVFYRANECLGSARISNAGPTNFIYYWLQYNKKCELSDITKTYKNR